MTRFIWESQTTSCGKTEYIQISSNSSTKLQIMFSLSVRMVYNVINAKTYTHLELWTRGRQMLLLSTKDCSKMVSYIPKGQKSKTEPGYPKPVILLLQLQSVLQALKIRQCKGSELTFYLDKRKSPHRLNHHYQEGTQLGEIRVDQHRFHIHHRRSRHHPRNTVIRRKKKYTSMLSTSKIRNVIF